MPGIPFPIPNHKPIIENLFSRSLVRNRKTEDETSVISRFSFFDFQNEKQQKNRFPFWELPSQNGNRMAMTYMDPFKTYLLFSHNLVINQNILVENVAKLLLKKKKKEF